jgi:hypothetical protein
MYDKDQQKKQKLKLVCPVKLQNTPLSRNQTGNSCKSGGSHFDRAHLTIYFICRASPERLLLRWLSPGRSSSTRVAATFAPHSTEREDGV